MKLQTFETYLTPRARTKQDDEHLPEGDFAAMKIKLVIICIFGIILIAGGGFAALMSPFLTDSGTPQMIRAFYIVLACAIATVCVGLIMTIWSLVSMFS
jgi:hypothetical protein